ncbi:hypothetical protein [Victivallis sp. Marseille-Q1083]|uniref:hypothetical protein n=1 Tax=Victivallis sp. Marseille-Q1083 TaxID=2717288 RepID=UPI00158EF614|nr:hypothetical protein [Victivallis sp. Marseille-Q1083]
MIFRILLFGWLCLAASGAVAATLTNERIKVTVSDLDGSVIGLEASDGGKIFRRIGERRRLETADREKNWDESLDEVLSSEAPEAGVLRLECRNPAAAEIDRIVKIYTLRPGDDFVSREIRIMPCGQAFIEIRTEAVLDSAFRRNGFYTAPFPVCAAPLPAGEVADPRPLFSTVYLLLSAAAAEMYNPARNQTAATWLIERNGRYCYWGFFIPDEKEVARQTILATPEGWEHLTNRDALRPGRENRWTVRYSLLEGDSSLLPRRMLESEPRRMMTDVSGVPDWLTRVKLMMFLVQADHRFSPETVAIWKRIAELPGPPGFLMPMFDLWGHQGGDCPTGTEEAKRAIEMAALTKREIPQARVGTYTILLADQASELMRRLPEIAVKDRQGGYPMADFPGRRMIQLHNPRAVDYFVDNWSRLMEETGCDFWYLDGGEGNAFECMDYGAMEVSGYGERHDFLRRLKTRIRNSGRERAVFFNSPAPLLADACFQELGVGQWTNEEWWTTHTGSNWCTLSDALYYAKLATRYRPGTWCSHLYPYVPQRYFSMMLALALKPNNCPITEEDFAVYRDVWLPFVNAAFEIRAFQIADREVSPNWRREKTDWDLFALESGSQLMVSAVNHGQHEAIVEAKLETLPPQWLNRPLYVRFHRMNPPGGSEPGKTAVVAGGPEVRTGENPLVLPFRLPPETAGAWILTDFPVWIRRLGEYPLQYRLNRALEVSVVPQKLDAGKELCFSVDSPDKVELEALIPDAAETVVRLDGVPAEYSVETGAAGRLAVFSCPAGVHRIEVRSEPGDR